MSRKQSVSELPQTDIIFRRSTNPANPEQDTC
jgi:hypothetical protein